MTKRKPKDKAQPKKMGRPSTFNQEKAATICAVIAEGKSLRTACAMEGMPPLRTIFEWLAANEDFSHQYARAREAQADAMADEMIDIADNNELDPNDRRVRLDTRKWLASKLRPKKYGEKLELSGDKENPLALQMVEARKAVDAKISRLISGPTDEA